MAPKAEPVPTVKVECLKLGCSEYQKPKIVNAGVLVGPGVLMYGTFACMVCGNTAHLAHE